jgi:RNA polymerase sigma factor (sigma-70 family)
LGTDQTEKLTRGMAAGHRDSVEAFYRQYFDYLYVQARRETGRDEAFCLDVVQEAVLRIIRNIKPVSDEPCLRAWMKLVVRTTALDQFRAEKRRNQRAAIPIELHSCDDFPYMLFEDEQFEWVKAQLEKFDPQIVEMIELRFEQKWTLARIGQRLGLSPSAIDGRLRRAIAVLRSRAHEEFDNA